MRRVLAIAGLIAVIAGASWGYYRSAWGTTCLGGVNGQHGVCERTYFTSWTGAVSSGLLVAGLLLLVAIAVWCRARLLD